MTGDTNVGPNNGAPTSTPGDRVGRVRVLLVEDNAVNRTIATRLCERLGCDVDHAENGVEALAAVRRGSYDLVFMDIHMPEMDGYDTTREIRALDGPGHHTPIVALTANALTGDRERCLAVGMDDYISKPAHPHEIERAIRHWGKIRGKFT